MTRTKQNKKRERTDDGDDNVNPNKSNIVTTSNKSSAVVTSNKSSAVITSNKSNEVITPTNPTYHSPPKKKRRINATTELNLVKVIKAALEDFETNHENIKRTHVLVRLLNDDNDKMDTIRRYLFIEKLKPKYQIIARIKRIRNKALKDYETYNLNKEYINKPDYKNYIELLHMIDKWDKYRSLENLEILRILLGFRNIDYEDFNVTSITNSSFNKMGLVRVHMLDLSPNPIL